MVILLDGECYYHDLYDPFNHIECKFDSSCTGSFQLSSNFKPIKF